MDDIARYLEEGVQQSIFSCGVLVVFNKQGPLLVESIGKDADNRTPTINTRFDLASLTKVVATLPLILDLLEENSISLDGIVQDYLTEFEGHPYGKLSVYSLLRHSAGLPAHIRFYEQKEQNPLKALLQQTTQSEPDKQVVYSDTGYILLGLIIERMNKEILAESAHRVFLKLGMGNTNFSSDDGIPTRVIGAVDDGNARFFNRNTGHAGLFGTARDLARYLQFWDSSSASFYLKAMELQTETLGDRRGLGWVLSGGKQSFFEGFSTNTIGHTGYTGTSIMLDKNAHIGIVFLTNRVLCGTDQRFISYRKELHRYLREFLELENQYSLREPIA
ncbi:hypothetical protein RU97_GL002604 [Enterococcus canis]|uniref:Beta-lactamase-related domain-containing protein n=1 Tax=Enterococcus canis TaxID=214095 RepID=A0A1L8RCV8_9ENTE|nr:serine hydrolase domain-containing protein [Enterococcus canis]OJG17596.1 hypothetical protein RU97_GL002604 [Enterococcus canis]